MKVLLCGYHEAGYRALRILIARGHEVMVASHATPPEIPSVPALAKALSLKCIEGPVEEVYQEAARFNPDLVLSVYYRLILPAKLLDIPTLGAYNFHPALLPKHRGCFSAVWAIIDGDKETGVTCHRMIGRVDAGGIVDVNPVPIDDNDTGISLYYKLVDASVDLFERVLIRAEEGALDESPQEGDGSYHRRGVPFDGVIDPTWPRDKAERLIRALHFPPYPPAKIEVEGKSYPISTIEEYDRCKRELNDVEKVS